MSLHRYHPVDKLIITAVYPCPDTSTTMTGSYLFKYPVMLHDAEDTLYYRTTTNGPLMEICSLDGEPDREAILDMCFTITGASPLDQEGNIKEGIMQIDCEGHGLVPVHQRNFQLWSWVQTDLPGNVGTVLVLKARLVTKLLGRSV